MLKIIGIVKEIVGDVKVTTADGAVKFLSVGDQIHAGDVLDALSASSAKISYLNGDEKTLNAGNSLNIPLDETALTPQNETIIADVEAILEEDKP